MPKVNVIIPARNEECALPELLGRLSPELYRPIVAINDTQDNTRQVVENYGVESVNIEQAGKMLAIQEAIRKLASSSSGDSLLPTLIIDADTVPIFPQRWGRLMVESLMQTDHPAVVSGLSVFRGGGIMRSSFWTAYRSWFALRYSENDPVMPSYGPNMGIRLHNADVLDAVLALPNFWPGEDKALSDTICERGGVKRLLLNPLGTCFTDVPENYFCPTELLRKSREELFARLASRYTEEKIGQGY